LRDAYEGRTIATSYGSTDALRIRAGISANPLRESHPSGFLHFINRASKVPGATETPLDIPSHAGCNSLDVSGNGSVDLWPPTGQPFLPHIEFLGVVDEEVSSNIHGRLQIDPSFLLDDGDEVVGRVTPGLFLVVTVDILQSEIRQILGYKKRRDVQENLGLAFAVKSISPAILVRLHNAG